MGELLLVSAAKYGLAVSHGTWRTQQPGTDFRDGEHLWFTGAYDPCVGPSQKAMPYQEFKRAGDQFLAFFGLLRVDP